MNSGGVLNDQMTFDLSMSDITNTLRDFNFTNLPFRYTYNYIQRLAGGVCVCERFTNLPFRYTYNYIQRLAGGVCVRFTNLPFRYTYNYIQRLAGGVCVCVCALYQPSLQIHLQLHTEVSRWCVCVCVRFTNLPFRYTYNYIQRLAGGVGVCVCALPTFPSDTLTTTYRG